MSGRWRRAARGLAVAVLAVAGIVAVGGSLAASPVTEQAPVVDEQSPPAGDVQRGLWLRTNQLRAAESALRTSRGQPVLALLRYDSCLERAAQQHAQAMVDRGFFDHDDPRTGTDPRARALAAGVPMSAFAENIAAGAGGLDAIFALWAESLGHRRNLLDPKMVAVGIGYADRRSDGRLAEPHYVQLLSGASAPAATCR